MAELQRQWDVTAVGEVLVRLSTSTAERLEAAGSLRVDAAGSESNVLANLAALGRDTALVTGLPKSPTGRLIVRRLRASGVDVDRVIWCESGRAGILYVEPGHPPRPTRVVYDRAVSCASQLDATHIDWNYLLGSRICHITGVSAAISTKFLGIIRELKARALEAGVPMSFDVNYRNSLWGIGDARPVLTDLAHGVEILFCSSRDARGIFELSGKAGDMAEQLGKRTGAQTVVVSDGPNATTMWHQDGYTAVTPPSTQMVDRLGAGDALAAGVLDGWLDNELERGIRQGVLLAGVVLGQTGDTATVTRSELRDMLTDASPEIVR